MKKLLALLGVTTLVTSASVAVVACTSTDVEIDYENDNDIEFRQLLNNFKTEITQRFNNNYNNNVNNFSLFNEDLRLDDYKFLNLQNLEEIGTNDEYVLNRTEFLDFLNDINLLLNVDTLKNDINQLTSDLEYSLLTTGLDNNIFDSFEIKNNQISLEINEDKTYGLSVNLRFELILNFNYVKKGEIETQSLNAKNLSFSIINDSKVHEVVQNIINDLGKELYKSENSSLYFTDKKLQMEDAFKENITGEAHDYVLSTSFKQSLSSHVTDIASISNMDERIEVDIKFLRNSGINWNQQFAKTGMVETEEIKLNSDLFKILANPNKEDYSYEQRIEIIETEYSSQLDDTKFKDNLNKSLQQNELTPETKVNYDSILGFGDFDISSIVLVVGGSKYGVPTLNLLFDYSVEDFKRDDYSSQILNSITAFQNVYEIEADEKSVFKIKNKYFWNIVDKRHQIGSDSFNKHELNEITFNYALTQINELSFDIGKQAKFGADGFDFYINSGGKWKNTNNGILTVWNISPNDEITIQLGIFFIKILISDDELGLLNTGNWMYFRR